MTLGKLKLLGAGIGCALLLAAGSRISLQTRNLETLQMICGGTWNPVCLRAQLSRLSNLEASYDSFRADSGTPGMDHEDRLEFLMAVLEAEARYGISHQILMAVATVESSLDPMAISTRNAHGLMQIRPTTALHLWPGFMASLGEKQSALTPSEALKDPRYSVLLAGYYLSHLRDRFGGNMSYALASYYVGPGRLKKGLNEGELLGQSYIQRVKLRMKSLRVLRAGLET